MSDDRDAYEGAREDLLDWKRRYFKMRDERDKAKIAAANYANFNHEWRERAERAEAELRSARELIALLEGEQARADRLEAAAGRAFGAINEADYETAFQALCYALRPEGSQ